MNFIYFLTWKGKEYIMKKKSLALIAIAVVMVASIATAYTLAYFTDSKSKENVFTVGDVKLS